MNIQKCNIPSYDMSEVQKKKCPSIYGLKKSIIIYFVIIIIGCFNYYRKKEEYDNNEINKKPKFFNYMKQYFILGIPASIFMYYWGVFRLINEIQYNDRLIKKLMDNGMNIDKAKEVLKERHHNKSTGRINFNLLN